MSQTVDTKVLEMRFDNKQFESNARTTINTLDNLKRALNENISGEAFENLDRAAKSVDLSSIESSLETLTDRFSTMGIVGMRVIENLTDGLMNLVKRGINYASDAIVSGGLKRAQNIENAHFQLQGLLNDEEKVQQIMDDALQSVDQTAYAYDEAAKAASMFAASGVEGGEQMQGALKAIAGVAATTNSDYERMANIFTTVAGQGKLMTMQLRQLETSGMNAAASMADYFNKVKNEQVEASEAVKNLVAQLSGSTEGIENASGAISQASDDIIKAQQKANNQEYKAKKKTYDNEYKDLKATLDAEYNLKKKEYDNSYKALSNELDAEIKAVQKANSERLNEANRAYQEQVQAYRDATNERIKLINEEYVESIKLIDEERYNKIKAIDDQIEAINKQAEEEEKARRKKERSDRIAAYEEAIKNAQTISYREELQKELSDYKQQLAQEDLAEERQERIKGLNQEKDLINDEYDEKKKAAMDKRSTDIELVQNESNIKLQEMAKAHQAEIEAIQESNQIQLEQMRENKALKLEQLKEAQTNELNTLRSGQSEQLEVLKEKQQQELEDFREAQNEKLEILKQTNKNAIHALDDFDEEVGFTEAQIRDMITDGLIDFDTFSEAMATTFGDHAKDANKTFTGAMANIRSAFAKIGALFYSPLIKEQGPLVDLLNAIRIKVNEYKNELAPVAEIITSMINRIFPVFTQYISNMDVTVDSSLDTLRGISALFYGFKNIIENAVEYVGLFTSAFKEAFNINPKSFREFSENFFYFTQNLKKSNRDNSKLVKVFTSLSKLFKTLWDLVKRLVKSFEPLKKLFGDINVDSGSLVDTFAELIDKFANWVDKSTRLEKTFKLISDAISLFVDLLIIAKGKIQDFFTFLTKEGEDGSESLLKGFVNGIVKFAKSVYDYVAEFASNVIKKIREIFGIASPSTETFEMGEMLLQGLINGIKSFIDKTIEFISSSFNSILDAIKGVFANFNSEDINMGGEDLGGSFISDFIEGVKNYIPSPIESMKQFFNEIKDKLLDMKIGDKTGEDYISSFMEGFRAAVDKAKEKINPIIETVTDKIHEVFDKFSSEDGLENGINYILSFLKGIKETIIEKGTEAFSTVTESIKELLGEVPELKIVGLVAGALATVLVTIQGIKSGVFAGLIKLFKIFKLGAKAIQGINFLKAKENIEGLIDAITSKVSFIPESIIEGFEEGLLKCSEVITTVAAFFQRIVEAIKDVFGIHSPATEAIAWATNIVTTFVDTIGNLIGPASEKIAGFFSLVVDSIVKVFTAGFDKLSNNEAAALSFIGGITALLLLLKLSKRLDTLIGPFHRVNGVLLNVQKALKAFAFDTYAEGILKVSAAVTILLGAMATFMYVVDQLENGDRIAISLIAIAAALAALFFAVNTIIKSVNKIKQTQLSIFSDDPKENFLIYIGQGIKKVMTQWTFSHTMKSFAKSILMIVLAFIGLVVTISKYKDDPALDYAKWALIAIAGTVLVMGVLGLLIAKLVKKYELDLNGVSSSLLKFGGTILAICLGIWVISDALKKLVDLDMAKNKDKVLPAIGAIAILLLALAGIMVLYSWFNNDDAAKGFSIGPVLSFALGLLITVAALKKLIAIDIKDEDKWKLWILFGLIVVLGVVVFALEDVANQGSGILSGGGVILSMCIWLYACIGAIALLANFDAPTLIKGILSIIFLCFAISIVVSNANKDTSGSFKTILAMAAALAMCLVAIGVFSTFDPIKLFVNGVLPVCLILLAMAFVFSQIAKIDTSVGANKLVALVVALGVIAGGLWLVSNKLIGGDWLAILMAGISMAGVLAVYGWILGNISKTKFNKGAIKNFNLGVIAVGVIAASIAGISNSYSGGTIGQILAAGISLCGALKTYADIFKDIAATEVNKGAIGNFLLGSLSLVVIGGALAAVAWADWKSILSAGFSVSDTLKTYKDVFKSLTDVNVEMGTIKNFLLGSIGVAVIGGALAAVAWADWKSILAAGASVTAVLDKYSDVFKSLKDSNEVETSTIFKYLLGVVGIILIGGTIAVMAYFCDWKALAAAGTGIALVLSKYKDVFAELDGVEIKKGAIKNYLLATVSIAIIGAVIAGTLLLASINGKTPDWKALISIAGGISLVLYVIAKAVNVLSGIGKENVLPAIGSIIGACIGALILAFALGKMSDTKNALDNAIAISIVLVAVAIIVGVSMLVADQILATGFIGGAVLAGTLALIDAFIAATAEVCTKIVALASIFPEANIQKGRDNLIAIGEGIGGFFGGIVKGFINLTGIGIEQLGSQLANFMTNAEPFFTGLANLKDNTLSKAETFANIAKTLSSSEYVSAMANFINTLNPFSKGTKEKFEEFGKSITVFANETKDIKGLNAKYVSEACLYLAQALGYIDPVKDLLSSMALDTLGARFKQMASAISGIFSDDAFTEVPNPKDYEAVKDSVLKLTEICDPRTGLASRDYNDVEDLPEVGDSLYEFSRYMAKIAEKMTDITDITPFTNLVDIAKAIIPLCTGNGKMISSDNFISEFVGTNDSGGFAANFYKFCKILLKGDSKHESIWSIISSVEIDLSKFDTLKSCAEKLFEIGKAVPITGEGKVSLPFFKAEATNNIATFGENIGLFVDGLIDLQGKLSGANLTSTDFINLKSASSVLFEMLDELKAIYLTDDNKIVNMGKYVGELGGQMKQFGEDIKDFGGDALKGYVGFSGAVELLEAFVKLIPDLMAFDGSAITDFFKSLKDNAKKGLKEFLDEFSNSQEAVTKAISTMFSYVSSAIGDKYKLMENLGRITVKNFAGEYGMNSSDALGYCVTSVNNLINHMWNEFFRENGPISSMKQLGMNAAYGFCNGLTSREAYDELGNAANRFGTKVYSEIAHSLAIESPSKETAKLGVFASLGFIDGLLSLTNEAGKAGGEVAESAADGLRSAISNMAYEIQNDDNFNPVITPVLDLSNIEENAGAIGGILDLNTPLSLAANAGMSFSGGVNDLLGNIQASMPDGSNADVVDAINQMRYDMSQMSAAIRQMQIVLDTGELVGAMTDPLDNSMGFNQILSERGVR